MKSRILLPVIILLLLIMACPPPDFPGHEDEIYIARFDDFPAYPYNTDAYDDFIYGYVGCGPTTAAMILGYFYNVHNLDNLLMPPIPDDVDQGLATAETLHSNQYISLNKCYDK